jgi:integrase/recombinase XerD
MSADRWESLHRRFLDAGAARGLARGTVIVHDRGVRRLLAWCRERELGPEQLTLAILERYQRHLHHYRKADGAPLSPASQQQLLMAVNAFCRWMVRNGILAANPAADLELPRVPPRLPRHWLSVEEIDQLIRHVEIYGEVGIRDRAIIETLYSTGLRRAELCAMTLDVVDQSGGIVRVREGKGRKDRVIPIGERALAWLVKYRDEVRPAWVIPPDDRRLWLRPDGAVLLPRHLTERMKKLIAEAGIDKPGACHILRHSMATHMLDGGADVRYLQAMLGHAQLSTTAIYTHVAIGQLKAVHAATHPMATLKRKRGDEDDDGAA